jgi:hypothetical protein
MRERIIGAPSESNNHFSDLLGLHLLNRPPAAAA